MRMRNKVNLLIQPSTPCECDTTYVFARLHWTWVLGFGHRTDREQQSSSSSFIFTFFVNTNHQLKMYPLARSAAPALRNAVSQNMHAYTMMLEFRDPPFYYCHY